MRGFVLDASVALRWLLDDPVPAYAHRIRQKLIAGDRAVVPALWHLEISNGLAVAERRSLLTAQDVDRALLDIEQMVAHAIHTEAALVAARQALATARAFRLSAYDAVYLDLAQQQRLPLATLDERLRTAATQAGVELVR